MKKLNLVFAIIYILILSISFVSGSCPKCGCNNSPMDSIDGDYQIIDEEFDVKPFDFEAGTSDLFTDEESEEFFNEEL